MRVLLIYPNRVRTFMPVGPIGMSYLLGNLDRENHPAKALDMMFQENPEEAVRDAILEFNPELIGLSIRNFDELDMASRTCYLPGLKKVVEVIREHSQTPLVLGGVGFTVMPKQLMAYLRADFGLIGEGERAFPELLNRLESGRDYRDLPGLVFEEKGELRVNPFERIEDLDGIHPPDRSFMDLQQYAQNRGFIGVISKKGCPQGCIWCPSPYYPGRKITLRDPVKVVNEIEGIQKEHDISTFYFCDDIFNNPPEHAKAVCDELISRKLEIVWGCDLNPATVNKDLLASMKRSGCIMAGPHFISASEKMLRQMTTGFTLDDLGRCCQLLEEAEVNYSIFMILGGPGESRETIEESIRFCQGIKTAAIFYFTGVRILPNTGMETYARNNGIFTSDEELLFPKFYLSKEVEGWLEDRLAKLSESDPRWVKLKIE